MSAQKNFCLIVNKAANSGRALSLLKNNWTEIQQKLGNVKLIEVNPEDSIIEIVALESHNFDVLVACGGDGTARKVAIGLKDSDTLFGLLPIGTGNDFAKMLGLSSSLSENLDALASLQTRNLDLIQFNESYFINTLGLGFDGRTNWYASKLPFIKGSSKYVIAGLQSLMTSKPFSVTIKADTEIYTLMTLMIVVANGKWEGGRYFVSKESVNDDGLFEIIIINNVSKIRLAIEFIRLSLGYSLSGNIHSVFRSNKAIINTSEAVFVHADGEVESQENQFEIKFNNSQLKVIYKKI